jgi:hypothetical protein
VILGGSSWACISLLPVAVGCQGKMAVKCKLQVDGAAWSGTSLDASELAVL